MSYIHTCKHTSSKSSLSINDCFNIYNIFLDCDVVFAEFSWISVQPSRVGFSADV